MDKGVVEGAYFAFVIGGTATIVVFCLQGL